MAIDLDKFVEHLTESGLISHEEFASFQSDLDPDKLPRDVKSLARELVRSGLLTRFQAGEIYRGKARGLVLGNYVVLDRLGSGGMGHVYKARHRRIDRVVALKVLSSKAMEQPGAVKRFHREVQAAARLDHRNIVAAYDADQAGDTHFLVMEFVDGPDLADVVKHQGTLTVEQAVDCMLQAARGLEYAHAQGVIHRDIKPSNLLVDASGTVKVLDMGLASIDRGGEAKSDSGITSLTQVGQIIGTIDYMSPEQAEDTRVADQRSDIYSLGCTLYFLLVGRPMFAAPTVMKKLLAHRFEEIPSLRAERPEVPEALEALYRRMVAKEPSDRPASMNELIAELTDLRKNLAGGGNASSASPGGSAAVVPESTAEHTQTLTWVQRPAALRGAAEFAAFLEQEESPPAGTSPPAAPIAAPAADGEFRPAEYPVAAADGANQGENTLALLERIPARILPAPAKVRRGANRPALVPWIAAAVVLVIAGGALWAVFGRPPPPGTVVVQIDEPGADLFINGRRVATTPAKNVRPVEVPLRPGNYLVQVRKEGFLPFEQQLAVRPGEREVIAVDLVAKPALAVTWPAGSTDDVMPGLVAAPARLQGVRRWQIETVYPRSELWCVAVGSDGRLVACGESTGQVRIYTVDGFSPLMIVPAGVGRVLDVALSHDGQTLAVGGIATTVRLWSIDGRPGPILSGHTGPVQSVAFNSAGQLASCGNDATVRIWEKDGTPGPILRGHTAAIVGVAWSRDGTQLASAAHDGTVRLWSADGTPGPVLAGHSPQAMCVHWSPDGTRLATGGSDRMLRLWRADGSLEREWMPHNGHVFAVAFSPGGGQIATCSTNDHSVRISSIDGTPGPVFTGVTNVSDVAWTPDGARLLAVSRERTLRIFNADGSLGAILPGMANYGVIAASWHPDGTRLATGVFDGSVRFWSAGGLPLGTLAAHTLPIVDLEYSPDGGHLATASNDGTAVVWNAEGKTRAVLQGHVGTVRTVAFHPGGQWVATAGQDATIRRWSLDGVPGTAYQGHTLQVEHVDFASDGRMASGDFEGFVRFWTADGLPGPVVGMTARRANAVAFRPDGEQLLAAYSDNVIRTWNSKGEEGPILRGHVGNVYHVAWSPDGNRIASTAQDGKVIVWNADGSILRSFDAHGLPGRRVEFSRDGKWLASAGMDNRVIVWDAATLAPKWSALIQKDGRHLAFTGGGEITYAPTSIVEGELRAVVEEPDGRLMLAPLMEFLRKSRPATR